MIACYPCVCDLPINDLRTVKMGIEKCFRLCLMYFNTSREYVLKRDRKRERVLTRQMCLYACSLYTNESLCNIGHFFGGYDHTTVIHSKKTIDNLCETDDEINDKFEGLRDFIRKNKI